jgi:hypothetical protein
MEGQAPVRVRREAYRGMPLQALHIPVCSLLFREFPLWSLLAVTGLDE